MLKYAIKGILILLKICNGDNNKGDASSVNAGQIFFIALTVCLGWYDLVIM